MVIGTVWQLCTMWVTLNWKHCYQGFCIQCWCYWTHLYAATQTNKYIHYKTVELARHVLNSMFYEYVSINGLLGAVRRSDKKWGLCVSFITSYWGRDISCMGGLHAYLQVENLWGKRSQGGGSKAYSCGALNPWTLFSPVGFLYRSMCGSATVIFLQAHCCWMVVSHGINIRPLSSPLEVYSRLVRIFLLHMPNASPFW